MNKKLFILGLFDRQSSKTWGKQVAKEPYYTGYGNMPMFKDCQIWGLSSVMRQHDHHSAEVLK